MRNLLITIAIVIIASSCSTPINELKGRYKPITIADFTINFRAETHILELREDREMYILDNGKVMPVGRFYENLEGDGLIWNYKDSETHFYFNTNKGDTILKFYKRSQFLILTYKKISSVSSKPVEENKNNWLK